MVLLGDLIVDFVNDHRIDIVFGVQLANLLCSTFGVSAMKVPVDSMTKSMPSCPNRPQQGLDDFVIKCLFVDVEGFVVEVHALERSHNGVVL